MAAAGKAVELIGMKTESAVGCQVNGDDAKRCGPKENYS